MDIKLPRNWNLLNKTWDGVLGISLTEAYNVVKDRICKSVVVAIISNGLDTAHEDLKGKLWFNIKEINGNGIDDDKNGYTDDIYGWNFYADRLYRTVPNDVTAMGSCYTGTRIGGIIGALRNNGIGIDGIVDSVKLMVIRASVEIDCKQYIDAIKYAVDNGAKIIVSSAPFDYHSIKVKNWKSMLDSIVMYAAKHNVLIVQGTDGIQSEDIDFNAKFPYHRENNFISVSVSFPIVSESFIWAGIHYGKRKINVLAPGYQIYSTLPKFVSNAEGKYGYRGGTGGIDGAAVVGGIAALILSYFPDLSATQLKYIIEHSVDKLDNVKVKVDDEKAFPLSDLCSSGGIVNAYNAIKLASAISRNGKARSSKTK